MAGLIYKEKVDSYLLKEVPGEPSDDIISSVLEENVIALKFSIILFQLL